MYHPHRPSPSCHKSIADRSRWRVRVGSGPGQGSAHLGFPASSAAQRSRAGWDARACTCRSHAHVPRVEGPRRPHPIPEKGNKPREEEKQRKQATPRPRQSGTATSAFARSERRRYPLASSADCFLLPDRSLSAALQRWATGR
jgi:hypothetical protein